MILIIRINIKQQMDTNYYAILSMQQVRPRAIHQAMLSQRSGQ